MATQRRRHHDEHTASALAGKQRCPLARQRVDASRGYSTAHSRACRMSRNLKVDVRRSGRRFEAEVVLDLAADPQTVWDTVTDYEGLASFMPGIHACRVIQRQAISKQAEHLVVEQRGEFRFMLFAQAMTVRLNIEHRLQRV